MGKARVGESGAGGGAGEDKRERQEREQEEVEWEGYEQEKLIQEEAERERIERHRIEQEALLDEELLSRDDIAMLESLEREQLAGSLGDKGDKCGTQIDLLATVENLPYRDDLPASSRDQGNIQARGDGIAIGCG